jgi:hypothetical protein
MTPAQAEAAIQEASAYNNISTNPELTSDALQSLNQQKQVATQGGMTAIDRAQLNDIQQQLGNQNAAQQQAIDTAAAQQGMSTAGSRLAQKMLASQGNSTAAANAGSSVAANAQARALQAMQNYGTQAQSLQNQQYNQQAQAAQAQNAINQFNAQNRQSTGLMNMNAANQANALNFNTANTIGAKNTDIANQQAQMPYNAAQANFSNAMNRNIATSNALNKQGTALMDQGNKQSATNTGYLTELAKNAPAIYNGIKDNAPAIWDTVSGWFSDERLKEDVKPADDSIETMMENLTGKKFKYSKASGMDDGKEHVSPMAQDIEKAGLPVQNTERGKLVIDNDDTKGAVLAALGNLHRRVSDLER